jgi:hypothetical protein
LMILQPPEQWVRRPRRNSGSPQRAWAAAMSDVNAWTGCSLFDKTCVFILALSNSQPANG